MNNKQELWLETGLGNYLEKDYVKTDGFKSEFVFAKNQTRPRKFQSHVNGKGTSEQN